MHSSSHAVLALKYLRNYMKAHQVATVVVFTGDQSFMVSGGVRFIDRALRDIPWTRYLVKGPLLTPQVITRAAVLLRESSPDLVIALGGGSVMDCAKCATHLAAGGSLSTDEGDSPFLLSMRRIPVVAIPTTSGSGAEVTPFATIWVDGTKTSLQHVDLAPRMSLYVPHVLKRQPPYVLACSALDALTQAMEAYWSVKSTPQSQRLADSALQLLWPEFGRMAAGAKPSVRALSIGARLSGEAIAISNTTACHALSYPLTGRYGVAHGHAVAIMLPGMLKYIGSCPPSEARPPLESREVKNHAEHLAFRLGADSVEHAYQLLITLLDKLGIRRSLVALGCGTPQDLRQIISDAFSAARFDNLPRAMDQEAAATFLKHLL